MKTQKLLPYLLLSPALFLIFSLFFYPTFYSWYLCFFNIKAYYQGGFVGLFHFQKLITDPSFLNALYVTFFYVMYCLIIEILFGLGLAVLLNEIRRGTSIIQVFLTLPLMITPVVTTLVFKLIFIPAEYGMINKILALLNLKGQTLLTSPQTAIIPLIVIDVWQWTPFVTLILLAGIKGIPPTLFEVADIDGAKGFEKFIHVTVPLLGPSLIVAIFFNGMRLLKTFDTVAILTRGGPIESTNLISYYIRLITVEYMKLSAGAAATQILLAIILIICNIFISSRYFKEVFGVGR